MNAKVKLGLLGLNFGSTVCRQLQAQPDLPVRLTKICDLDAEKARAASHEFGLPWTQHLEDLLNDPDLDAIGLYTRPSGRAALIQQTIRAGKHVMTTKPFELDAGAALAVLREAENVGRVVHLNSPNARPYGEMAIIREWLDAGAIGRPTVAAIRVVQAMSEAEQTGNTILLK
ncbi:MAG: Gfo/Idh/MocA family oxidoreductase [Candidatus Hydrogenedentes bacterium]|nr:Gfo/Idh/MocA family oxidoreductase [Candidatus Hydrogenedentota bacterium]